MPKGKNTKVWNEDLVKALQARADVARRQGKKAAVTLTSASQAIAEGSLLACRDRMRLVLGVSMLLL
jgi:hypothetical protein